MIRLGEDPGKREGSGGPEARLRLVRGGAPAAAAAPDAGGGAGEGGPGQRPRVIDLQKVRSRGRAGAPAGGGDVDAGSEEEGPLEPDWKDILALIIATFEVLGPFLLMLFGAAGLVYLFLKLIAH